MSQYDPSQVGMKCQNRGKWHMGMSDEVGHSLVLINNVPFLFIDRLSCVLLSRI